jgi:hypothetical protein
VVIIQKNNIKVEKSVGEDKEEKRRISNIQYDLDYLENEIKEKI